MWRLDLPHDECTYTTLINAYCAEGDIKSALHLHDEMIKKEFLPDVVTYNVLLNGLSRQARTRGGNLQKALDLYKEMVHHGFVPHTVSVIALIKELFKEGRSKDLSQVIENTLRSCRLTDAELAKVLVEYSDLLRLFEYGGLSPDLTNLDLIRNLPRPTPVPDTSLLCDLLWSDPGRDVKGWGMNDKGVSLDAVAYSSLILGLCQHRRLTEACDIFQEMWRLDLPPDECIYTTLINAYCVEGDIKSALHLHDEIIKKGFLPDVVTYNVLLNGLSKQARTREAKQLLFKLFYEESIRNDVTYTTLIENCSNTEFKNVVALTKGFCMHGLMNEVDHVFESMLQRNCKPSEAVYNVIIHGHCRDGNLQKALDLYKEMVHHGFVPHTVSVIALIKELFKEGRSEDLSQVIENTLRSCRLTDAELAKVLVEVNHKEGNMAVIFNVLTEMAKDGLLPNSGETFRTSR
ncbi:hypothetical protein ACSBR2_035075 [Camellia fascicularis]